MAFLLPFRREGGFWTGYAFSTLAILILAAVGYFAFGNRNIKSKYYGFPLMYVAWSYFVVQISVGFIEMLLPFIPYQFFIVLNVILLGACLLGLIGAKAAKDEIRRIDKAVKEKVLFITSLNADIDGILTGVTDSSLKKTIKNLSDSIKYSDPMSSSQLSPIENRISNKVAALASSIADIDAAGTICGELGQLIAERNRKCKILKG
jgi:hypothetical protein